MQGPTTSSSRGAASPVSRRRSTCTSVVRPRPSRSSPPTTTLAATGRRGARGGGGAHPPLPVMASTAGSYCVAPHADFQREMYARIGLHWERYRVEAPFYCYYFDDRTPGVRPGQRGWNLDTYG